MKYLYSFNSHSDFYNKGMVLEDDNVVLCKDTNINKWHGHYQHPPYDAEIEYLENSTGREAIDTGIYGTNTTQVSFETMFFNTKVPDYTGGDAFGSGVIEYGNTQNVLGITYNRNQDELYSFLGNNYKSIKRLNLLTGIKHTITYSSKGTWVNGVKKQNGWYNNSFQTPYTISAMTTRRAVTGNFGGSLKARLYNFSISDNGVLVRDLIPVRVGNVGYMYDKVSGQLFGNAGTGNFILGPDIQPIEYLESTGTQYIDTKLIHSVSNYEYYIDFTPSENENNTAIFGSSKSNYWDGQSWSTSNNLYIGSSTLSGKGFGRQANIRETIRLIVNGNKIIGYKNGTKYLDTTFNGTIISGYQILLFAYTFGNNNASGLCKAKVHSFYIIMNNKKVFYGIPVRVGNVGYMYDRVSGKLFGNSGTGSFILGPDL